jgi:glycosyltransferase involved in cell wall biosynthesis
VGGEPDAVAAVKAELEGKRVKNVSLPGFVPNSELPLYLAACDVLLLPNQRKVSGSGGGDIARWMSPMKLFEYMACGRLIIASDLPVLREVLSEQNALLCDPEDLDAWEQGLERAVEDKAWRQRLGQQALRDARRYAWTRRVDVCLQPIVQNLPHAKT